MESDDIIKYCDRMEDIKRRLAIVAQLSGPGARDLPAEGRLESIYLQYRKILEQIAFASLISNREKFSKTYARFSKYWNAADLLRDLERVNRHFYPVPVTLTASEQSGVRSHIADKKSGYLTKSEFLELYGRTGDILHERNPYAGAPDLVWFEKNVDIWCEKIIGLLNMHAVHLFGQSTVYIVQMIGEGGYVHHYTLTPTD